MKWWRSKRVGFTRSARRGEVKCFRRDEENSDGLTRERVARSEGADFRAPLGIAVIGGVITSTLLTLLVIPTVYEILSGWRDALRARFARTRGPMASDTHPRRPADPLTEP